MFQKLRHKLKEQHGMTLIELLAVIVILGIIAAIAVPSILGLIENSKKDAHVGNAQQMVAAARNAIAQNEITTPTSDSPTTILLKDLIAKGYVEDFDDPTDSTGYNKDTSKVVISVDATDAKKLNYAVTLIGAGGHTHINGIDSKALNRKVVTP